MKSIKFIIIVFMLTGYSYLSATINLSWSNPELQSKFQSSFLENTNDDEVKLINEVSDTTHFALQSAKRVVRSVKDYFSNSKDDSFLIYPILKKNVEGFIAITPRVGYDYISDNDRSYSFIHYGLDLDTNLNNSLFLTAQWWSGHFSGDIDYVKESSNTLDSWIKTEDSDDILHLDNIKGKLDWRGRFGSISLGRGTYQVGSNISGSIILNNDTNDYGYFAGILDLGKIKLSLLHGNLIPDSTNYEMGEPYNQTYKFEEKYLVIHKLDWFPNKNLYLFLGEAIVYGSRSIEPSYLLPHFFQRITEHNLADRDNVLIFGGWNIHLRKNLLFYSNIMLDELKKSEIFGDWWGNKYAIQAGTSLTTDFIVPLQTTIEFTAVRPWMYTHKTLVNKYSNDGRGIGYEKGSNLINYAIEINCEFSENIKLDILGEYQRQGSLGNSYRFDYDYRPKDTAKWLEGKITDTLSGGCSLSMDILPCHKFKLSAIHKRVLDSVDSTTISFSYLTFY